MESPERRDTPIFVDIAAEVLLNELSGDIPDANEENNDEQVESYLTIKTKRLKCPECLRYTTNNAEKLTRHIRKIHRGENPFQCFMCEYSTYNKNLFEEHIRIHKGIKPFKCAHCPHRNVSKKNLKKHEKIHRPDNPLKCPHCDHIARHKRGFAFHAKKYHPVKNESDNQCELCEKAFDNERRLAVHRSNVKTCTELMEDAAKRCGFKACSNAVIKLHKAIDHGKAPDRMRSKKDLFKCSLCRWSSCSKTRILLHLIHHPEQEVDESVVDVSILRKHGIMP